MLNRTVAKLKPGQVIPGDVAWRLYDTYGFPVDLTQLMTEEKGLKIDLDGYEEAKKQAQVLFLKKDQIQICLLKTYLSFEFNFFVFNFSLPLK